MGTTTTAKEILLWYQTFPPSFISRRQFSFLLRLTPYSKQTLWLHLNHCCYHSSNITFLYFPKSIRKCVNHHEQIIIIKHYIKVFFFKDLYAMSKIQPCQTVINSPLRAVVIRRMQDKDFIYLINRSNAPKKNYFMMLYVIECLKNMDGHCYM